MKERRAYKRHLVNEDVYVYRAERVGRISNISLTGLLCNCTLHNDCITDDFEIFCPGSSCYLINLPNTIIETRSIDSPPHFIRQCHLKFDPLPPEKILKLHHVIKTYSESDALPNE